MALSSMAAAAAAAATTTTPETEAGAIPVNGQMGLLGLVHKGLELAPLEPGKALRAAMVLLLLRWGLPALLELAPWHAQA